MSRSSSLLLLAAAVILLVAVAPAGAAEPVTFKVCNNQPPAFKRAGDDLLITCPGKKEPTLTLKGCVGSRVTRIGLDYTVTCTSWKRYDITPASPAS